MATTFTNLLFHIVFSTKHRKNLIDADLRDRLYPYLGGIIRQEKGALLEVGGMPDHVHLFVRLRAENSVAEMARLIKASSSKWINDHVKRRTRFQWQTGYAAFTMSESQSKVVRRYLQKQEEHHRQTTFQEEFLALLERHGIEYDPRYIWD
jgi:REP element-mobilizing transposase RayT